jgi:hypothetical protein
MSRRSEEPQRLSSVSFRVRVFVGHGETRDMLRRWPQHEAMEHSRTEGDVRSGIKSWHRDWKSWREIGASLGQIVKGWERGR